MSPSCTPRRSWRRRRRAFSNSYNLLLCALPCPACTPGRKKEKNVTRELDSNCPPAPFSPYALNFPFFLYRTYFFFLFFSFPLPCSFLDLSEEIRRRRDARNSAMSNISKREWKVGCPKIYSKSMIESCLWYHLGWQVDPFYSLYWHWLK